MEFIGNALGLFFIFIFAIILIPFILLLLGYFLIFKRNQNALDSFKEMFNDVKNREKTVNKVGKKKVQKARKDNIKESNDLNNSVEDAEFKEVDN